MANRGRRPRDDEQLAFELARGATLRDACAATGVSERTAARRVKDVAFMRRVTDIRQTFISQACGKLADSMSESADLLRAVVDNVDDKSAVRVRAAIAVLEHAVKLRDATELEERLAALERTTKGRGACPPDKPPGPTEDGATPTEDDGLPTESNDNVD